MLFNDDNGPVGSSEKLYRRGKIVFFHTCDVSSSVSLLWKEKVLISVRIFHRCHKGRERQSERYTGCVVCVCERERKGKIDEQWEKDKYMDLAIFVQAEGHLNSKVLKSLSSYIKNSEQRTTGRRFGAIYTQRINTSEILISRI